MPEASAEESPPEESAIDRVETGIRVVLSVLFWVIGEVVQTVLGLIVIFSLLFALIVGQRPSEAVRSFANHITTYLYRVYRYLTYNEPRAPFPFRELPGEIEKPEWSEERTELRLLGQSRRRRYSGDAFDD